MTRRPPFAAPQTAGRKPPRPIGRRAMRRAVVAAAGLSLFAVGAAQASDGFASGAFGSRMDQWIQIPVSAPADAAPIRIAAPQGPAGKTAPKAEPVAEAPAPADPIKADPVQAAPVQTVAEPQNAAVSPASPASEVETGVETGAGAAVAAGPGKIAERPAEAPIVVRWWDGDGRMVGDRRLNDIDGAEARLEAARRRIDDSDRFGAPAALTRGLTRSLAHGLNG